MTATIQKGYVDTRWGQLHYRRGGDRGPALVLLHQTANSSRMWMKLMPILGERLRVFALDTPGFGMSDPPPAQPTFDDYCSVFVEAIDMLGLAETALLGFHTGAGFAVGIAARSPSLVTQLVLMGAPVFDPDDDNSRRSRAARAGWEPDADGAYLERMWRISSNPDLWVRHRELTDRMLAGPRAWWASAAVSDTDIRDLLPAIACPTLLLSGSKDFMLAKQESARALIPNATLIVLPGETLIADERSEAVAERILALVTSGER
ncbi:MAG: alpha/beta fold hydrolase [Dehalococcoidia bacterium]